MHLDPWTSISFSPWVPGRGLKQGRQWWPDSGAYGGRRRGGIGGGARGGREGPRGGLGWARDGRSGGLVALGDGERVEEHRWGSRKLAGGSFGREEGWRKGFRGGLGGGGANGGGGGYSRQRGRAGLGVRAQKGRREGGERLGARGKGLDDHGRGRRRGAVGRRCTASPWRFDVHPRRACKGR